MFRSLLLAIFVSAVITTNAQSDCSPNSSNGHQVDTFRRFAHHVTIETDKKQNSFDNIICGGSIFDERWIITSSFCIDGSNRLRLHFGKLNRYSFNDSFAIEVGRDEVYIHPTYYYDIALIRLPILLVFSDTLRPISISWSSADWSNGRLAVVPSFDSCSRSTTTLATYRSLRVLGLKSGETAPSEYIEHSSTETSSSFGTTTVASSTETTFNELPSTTPSPIVEHKLIYGMFRVLSNNVCAARNNDFDEFKQLCTENWVRIVDGSTRCWNYGSGLIAGWPGSPSLIGIYSTLLNDCSSSKPVIFTKVAEFLPWIVSVTGIVNP